MDGTVGRRRALSPVSLAARPPLGATVCALVHFGHFGAQRRRPRLFSQNFSRRSSCPSEFPRRCSSGRHLPARTPWSPLVSAALAPCSSRNRHRSRRRWPPSSSPTPQSEAAECAELQVRAQGERLQPRRAEPIALRCVHALSSDRADQGPERVVSWSGRCRGSKLRLPLPRPALRRGPALARLLRVHAHAPVAVYSVRGSLELCATRPRAADERRLGGRLGGRWPTRETIRPLAPSAVRGGAACAPVAAFRRVSYVAEARLESGERPVANRREQQALANCRAVHFFVSKPELGIEGGS